MEQQVISGAVSTVALPGSGSEEGRDTHNKHCDTSMGSSRDLAWLEAKLLGKGAVPTHITIFLPAVPGPPDFLKQALTGGNGQPEHLSRETPDSFQKFSMQMGLPGVEMDLHRQAASRAGGGEGISRLGKHLRKTIFKG